MSMRTSVLLIAVLAIGFVAIASGNHPSFTNQGGQCCHQPSPEDMRSYHVQGLGEEGPGVVIESVEGEHGFIITSVIVAGGNVGDAILFQDGQPFLRAHTNEFLNFKSGIPLASGTTISVQQSGLYGATISGYVY